MREISIIDFAHYDGSKKDNTLQLGKITMPEEYCKEWNERMHDFVGLTRNGELISNSLFRVGMGGDIRKDYFMLLKYVEAHYDDSITKSKKEKKHLKGCWCILNKYGTELVNFDQFANPYLTSDSCIYSVDGKYYNIETGEYYGKSSTTMQSESFLFLDNGYDDDKSKRGVIKINKKDGTHELIR